MNLAAVPRIVLALAVGSALASGLYWAFLQTSEANIFMLVLSAALLIGVALASAATLSIAVWLAHDEPWRRAISRGLRGVPWALVWLGVGAVLWVAVVATERSISERQGEIGAWAIVQLNSDLARLPQIATWVGGWLRWAVIPLLCLTFLNWTLTRSSHALRSSGLLRSLAIATAAFLLLVVLPWRLTSWRPELPPTWIEPASAAARLGVVWLLGLLALALLIVTAAGRRSATRARESEPLTREQAAAIS